MIRNHVMALLKNTFARNWSLLVVSGLLCQVLGVLATFRIARVLAPDGYGQYNLVQVTGALGAIFAALGLSKVISRQCARTPEETGTLLVAATALRAIGLLCSGIGIVVYERLLGGTLSPSFMLAALILLVALNVWDTFESAAFGHELMQYSAVINLGGNILWLVVIWAVPAAWLTPLTISVAFVSLQFGEAVIYVAAAARRGWIRQFQFSRTAVRRIAWTLLRDGAFLWMLQLVSSATFQLPVLMLAARSGIIQVGLYNAGNRLISPLQLLTSAALASLYPGFSRLAHVNHERLAVIVGRSLVVIAALGSVGALGISLFRKELITILFGAKFSAASDVLAIQCWLTVLQSTFALIGDTLAAIDRQRLLAGLSMCYFLLSIPIIWVGTSMGAAGLALALLISGIINAIYHWVVLMRVLHAPLPRSAIPTAVLLVATGMAISWLVPSSAPFVARVGVAGLLGIVVLIGALWWTVGRARAMPKPVGVL